jgi:hypothetical protein
VGQGDRGSSAEIALCVVPWLDHRRSIKDAVGCAYGQRSLSSALKTKIASTKVDPQFSPCP